MKPLRLSMTAFGPYDNETVIDFEKFESSGLFLITGKTGSGKTTIFDAVTYCLYEKSSGSERDAKCMRYQLASKKSKTVVKLDFLYKGETYSIERTIAGSAKKDASIKFPDGRIITGSKDVTQSVTELLGIDYRQFSQIVMLAQGQFIKLLHADSKERGEIFRKIFDTSIYSEFQTRIGKKTSDLEDEYEGYKNDIITKIKDTNCPDAKYEWLVNYIKDPIIPDLDTYCREVNRLIEDDETEIGKINKEIKEMSEKRDGIIQKITESREGNNKLDEKTVAESKLNKLNEDKEYYKTLDLSIENAGKADAVRIKEQVLNSKTEQRTETENTINENTQSVENDKPLLKKIEEVVLELENDEKIKKLEGECRKINEDFAKYQELDDKNKKLSKVIKDIDDKNTELKSLEDYIKSKTDEREALKKRYDEIKDSGEKYAESDRLYENESNNLKDLKKIKSSLNELKSSEAKLKKSQQEYKNSQIKYNKINGEYEDLNKKFLDEQAGILSERLIDGEPCPVCGSVHHPKPAVISGEHVTKVMVDNAKAKLDESLEDINKKSNAANELKVGCDKDEQHLRELSSKYFEIHEDIFEITEQVHKRTEETKNKIKELKSSLKEIKKECEEKKSIDEELPKLEDIIKTNTQKKDEVKTEIYNLEKSQAEYQSSIETLKLGLRYPTLKEAEAALNKNKVLVTKHNEELAEKKKFRDELNDKISQSNGVIQSSSETLEKLIAEIAEKEEEFNKSLSENGFENKEAYESAKCEREKINEYADISKKYHDELNSAKTTLNKLIKDTKNISYIDIEVLNTELNELKSEIDKKGIAKEDISIRAASNKKILKGIEKIKGGMSEVFEYYKNCSLISVAAKGSINGKDKLPFELYIQSVYFDDILNHANTRLKIMSGGRYELVRAESADSRQRKTGLDIEVIDNYTALSRGVNSLSGGESFMAALSLALGLSDVIQYESGGIHIDTMFVDEGFGSLDAESLNSALKVLQNLTEGDRMVGIISHIEELKERIDRKIIVTKLSGGRSTLKLVR